MVSRIPALIHLAGVVLFLGNFVAAWLVYARARRTRDAAALAGLFGLVNAGDRWLMPVSVIAIVAGGAWAARLQGLSITGTGWIIWSFVALGVSGVVFLARLHGLQLRLESAATRGGLAPADYGEMLASWAWWTVAGTAPVLLAFGLMVLRPNLPGF